MVATAKHVVSEADEWQQPIRLQHHASKTKVFLKEGPNRIIIPADRKEKDSAVVLAEPGMLRLPDKCWPLLPGNISLPIGTEVGWLGFPSVAPSTLCFFAGNISARLNEDYLIDGIAINGVSGGPVFWSADGGEMGLQIIGAITAYRPNYTNSGLILPGLSMAADLSHVHEIVSGLTA